MIAHIPSRDATFELPAAYAKFIQLTPSDIRDRHLTRFEKDIVDRVELSGSSGRAIKLRRKIEGWDRVAPDGKVSAVSDVNIERNLLRLMDFILKAEYRTASPNDVIPPAGLSPICKVSFKAYSSGNTAEDGAGEKEISTLRFFSSDSHCWAQIDDEQDLRPLPQEAFSQIVSTLSSILSSFPE